MGNAVVSKDVIGRRRPNIDTISFTTDLDGDGNKNESLESEIKGLEADLYAEIKAFGFKPEAVIIKVVILYLIGSRAKYFLTPFRLQSVTLPSPPRQPPQPRCRPRVVRQG